MQTGNKRKLSLRLPAEVAMDKVGKAVYGREANKSRRKKETNLKNEKLKKL